MSQVHRSASVPMIRTSITIPFRANFAFKKECLRIERVGSATLRRPHGEYSAGPERAR